MEGPWVSGPWLVGPWVSGPLIYRGQFLFFLPCGTMFPHGYYLAGDVAAWRASDRIRAAEIAWTRVHAITDHNTCLKYILSEMIAGLTFRHVDAL